MGYSKKGESFMTPLISTLISFSIIFLSTTMGSALVFVVKKNLTDKLGNVIIGLASGIMVAVSFFGLLLPSIEESQVMYGNLALFPVVGGFMFGGLVLYLLDKLIPHFHNTSNEDEGLNSGNVKRNTKLFLAVTMHNIPEGIAVGLACGLAFRNNDMASTMSSLALAIGIAIQNFPEGMAISIPMLEEGLSKKKSFLFGMTSGLVEPIAAFVAFFVASSINGIMPFILSFSGGAMIYVTIEELLPEARKGNYVHYGLWSFMIGFALMMMLELMI